MSKKGSLTEGRMRGGIKHNADDTKPLAPPLAPQPKDQTISPSSVNRAIISITPDFLIQIMKGLTTGFKGKFEVIENGLPEDVQFVDMILEENIIRCAGYPHTILAIVESSSFPKSKKGELLPRLDATCIRAMNDE